MKAPIALQIIESLPLMIMTKTMLLLPSGRNIRESRFSVTARLCVVSWLALMLSNSTGCHSTGIPAARLPAKYRQAAQTPRQNINLASVATAGSSDSMIAPSDLLKVTVATSRDTDKLSPIQVRVANDGTADVPIVGPVPVAGMEVFEASQNIAHFAIQRGMYRRPLVTVEIEKKSVNRITVLGAVKEPGVHELPRGGCDLVSALAASGGLTEEAGMEVEIVRQPRFGLAANDPASDPATEGDIQLASYQNLSNRHPPTHGARAPAWSEPRTVRINLANQRALASSEFQLSDRDVVRVISRKKEMIHVSGLVKQPGQFEIPLDQDLFLLDAIALAGGRSSPIADKISIIRQIKDQSEPVIIQASLSKAKKNGLENLRLAAGDTINIEQTPATAVVDAFSRFFRLSLGVASNSVF